MISTAKLFRNGASQAVRLPKEFRFDGDEVCIKRIGSAVLLYPKGAEWDLMESVIGKVDDDFLPRREQPAKPDKRKRL
jgi:antitoxin VapB